MSELLAAHDAQVRARIPNPLPRGITVERDGPVVRFLKPLDSDRQGFVCYRNLDGLTGSEIDELIARQVQVFAERGQRFEWKLYGHDLPSDLPDRLLAAGLVPEEEETVLIAPADVVPGAPPLPRGVSLREVTDRADFDRIATLEDEIWGEGPRTIAEMLESERAANPDGLTVVVAEADSEVVCAGWVRFEEGTEFATLWGGATLPAWRGRGIYRALVAYRVGRAVERECRFLEVDASVNSRPILERLGFVAVTTTTPYIWSPA